jgi:hypothetical protein
VDIRRVTLLACYGPTCGIDVHRHLRFEIVDGHRYADEEPGWYSGRGRHDPDVSGSHAIGSSYDSAGGNSYDSAGGNSYDSAGGNSYDSAIGNPYDSGINERPSGAYRLPQQRPDPYALPGPAAPTTGGYSRSGDYDYDSGRIPLRGTEYPTAKPSAEPEPEQEPVVRQPDGVYRSRRPLSSVVVAMVTGVLMIPIVRVLIIAAFASDPTAQAVGRAVLLTLGMALTGVGLFAVSRGGPVTRDAWLCAPVVYLPTGLILLVAAGLAVA